MLLLVRLTIAILLVMGVPPHIRAWTMQKEIVASISSMVVTISRLHNITASIGLMRKIASLARDYANRRAAFSQNVENHPLHVQTMARMGIETRGCCVLLMP